MSSVQKALNNVQHGFQNGLKGLGYIATSAEPMDRFSKVFYKSIDLFVEIRKTLGHAISPGLLKLSSQVRGCVEVVEAIQFFYLAKDMFSPSWFRTNTWQKCLDRVTLVTHMALKDIKLAEKFGFLSLGKVGLVSVGHLPVFKLVTDGLYAVRNVFVTWDNANKLVKYSKDKKEAVLKVEKWEYRRETEVPLVAAGDSVEIEKLYKRYRDKVQLNSVKLEKLHAFQEKVVNPELRHGLSKDVSQLKKLETQSVKKDVYESYKKSLGNRDYIKLSKDISKQISKLETKQTLYQERVQLIGKRNFAALAQSLDRKDIASEKGKIAKWEIVQKNIKIDQTKAWLRIIPAIGKIAVIVLALTLTAINVWTAPLLITLLTLSVTMDSLALVKVFTEKFVKNQSL